MEIVLDVQRDRGVVAVLIIPPGEVKVVGLLIAFAAIVVAPSHNRVAVPPSETEA